MKSEDRNHDSQAYENMGFYMNGADRIDEFILKMAVYWETKGRRAQTDQDKIMARFSEFKTRIMRGDTTLQELEERVYTTYGLMTRDDLERHAKVSKVEKVEKVSKVEKVQYQSVEEIWKTLQSMAGTAKVYHETLDIIHHKIDTCENPEELEALYDQNRKVASQASELLRRMDELEAEARAMGMDIDSRRAR